MHDLENGNQKPSWFQNAWIINLHWLEKWTVAALFSLKHPLFFPFCLAIFEFSKNQRHSLKQKTLMFWYKNQILLIFAKILCKNVTCKGFGRGFALIYFTFWSVTKMCYFYVATIIFNKEVCLISVRKPELARFFAMLVNINGRCCLSP